jgi:general secretion pathway protein L
MLELQSEMNLQWTKGQLLGGASQLKNFGAFLTQAFEIPFNRFKQFEHHPAVTAETNPHLEMVTGAAVGLAIEALRRPRNPATNFMKGPFAQQSQFFESLWEKWGYTAQLAGIAFMIMLTYGVIRENFASSLADESDRVMRQQAEQIAGIKSRQASPSRINKFISNQDKLEKSRKSAERVVRMNSAMDVLNRISAVLPAKQKATLEIKRVSITNDQAEVQGYADNENQHTLIRQALSQAASDGKVEQAQMMIKPPAGKVGFAYKFRVDRYTGG